FDYQTNRWTLLSAAKTCPNQFENVSATDIPPYAALRVTGTDFNSTTPVYTVDQSDGTEPIGMRPIYLANSPAPVLANDYGGYEKTYGTYQTCDKVWLQYNSDSFGAPLFGE